MKRSAVLCLMVAFLAGAVSSQTVNLCGTVTDDAGKPLIYTVIRLSVTTYDNGYWATAPYLAQTDQNGRYHVGTGICSDMTHDNILPKGVDFVRPSYAGGKVFFRTPTNGCLVTMGLYDLSGRFVREVFNKNLSKGDFAVSIDARHIASQFYLLKVNVNGSSSVIRLQPATRLSGGTAVQSGSGFRTRMEKVAADVVMDTLRATKPGYSLGVKPITSLTGTNDFTLTKTSTWDGNVDAFWGDTNTYPKKGSTPMYVILNRTNGAWTDDKICWSNGGGAPYVAISENRLKPIVSERMYVYIAPNDSNKRYNDFLEVNYNGTWNGNSTRVDGWRLPFTFRIKTTTGKDTVMGDAYEMFFQTRKAKFDEFINEVPKEFTHLATQDFAHIWAPHTCPVSYFNTNQKYVDYYKRYQDSIVTNYVKDPTWTQKAIYPSNTGDPGPMIPVPTAWQIFACTGAEGWQKSIGASPWWSAAMNRHVAHMEPHGIDWRNWGYTDTASFYQAAPANFFSRWCHLRSINNYCYGFPYDDNGDHQAFMTMSNIQWIAVAVGW
jgi:hypothetical protein